MHKPGGVQVTVSKTPFVLATSAKVGPDIHAKVGHTLYSIPWRYLGSTLDARETGSVVQFFHDGTLIKTHRAPTRETE